jgi:hypothetical protein
MGISASVAPLSWDAPRRVALRSSRGTLVLCSVTDVTLLALLDTGASPEELRLPMEAAIARLRRIVRGVRSSPAPEIAPPVDAAPAPRPNAPPAAPLPHVPSTVHAHVKGPAVVRADTSSKQSPGNSQAEKHMVQINFAQKAGQRQDRLLRPGMSGKTTNLEIVHQRAPAPNRGDLTSISTDGDRTLFFDFMPLDSARSRACARASRSTPSRPGLLQLDAQARAAGRRRRGVRRRLVGRDARGEPRVAAQPGENLNEYGKSLANMPHVIQFNKRDLPDAMPVDELNAHLNPRRAVLRSDREHGPGRVPDAQGARRARARSDPRRQCGRWTGRSASADSRATANSDRSRPRNPRNSSTRRCLGPRHRLLPPRRSTPHSSTARASSSRSNRSRCNRATRSNR